MNRNNPFILNHPCVLHLLLVTAAVGLAVAVTGCSSTPASQTGSVTAPPPPPSEQAGEPRDPLYDQVNAYAQQLEQTPQAELAFERERRERQAQHTDAAPEVNWLNYSARRDAALAQRERAASNTTTTDVTEVTTNPGQPAIKQVANQTVDLQNVTAAARSQNTLDRRELLVRLRDDIRNHADSPMRKALAASALSLADPTVGIDPQLMEPLTSQERDAVIAYQRLMANMADQLAAGDPRLGPAAVQASLEKVFGRQPLTIRAIKLCRRVEGFGVYQELGQDQFLARREHPMIVYVELENFRVKPTSDELNEVRLNQQIELITDPGGLKVWEQDQVQIIDQSRNHRRDFFVVQTITLPAELSVGRYRLKVRTSDLNGNSVAEDTYPIQIVADRALVHRESER